MGDTNQLCYIQLAQFEAAISEKKLDKKVVAVIKHLIDEGLDVNYRLTPTSSFKLKSNQLGCTALHLALEHGELDVFHMLLEHGADYTIKNAQGKTVVHQAMERSLEKKEAFWMLRGQLEHPFIEAVLQKHVSSKNSSNPYSKEGLSHFHAACMTNNVQAVEFFLKNGELVNRAIDQHSEILPGYTPLHLAARYCAAEVTKVLLDCGANVLLKNSEGLNPLLTAIERSLQIINYLDSGKRAACEKILNQDIACHKVLHELVNSCNSYNRIGWTDDIGFSGLHIACFTKDASLLRSLLDKGYNVSQIIRRDSPIFPGYTVLHFAARRRNLDVTTFLLKHGANILAKDAKGITPFDLMLELYNPKELHSFLLSRDAWKSITFSDGKTKLVELVEAASSRGAFESFLKSIAASVNVYLPADSPIWPGFTPLHLALIFLDRTKELDDLRMDIDHKNYPTCHCSTEEEQLYFYRIEACLKLGADITIKNAEGLTPLHLAFEKQKYNIVDLMLQFHEKPSNPTNDAGLSHFHIACATGNILLAKKLLLEDNASISSRLPSRLSYQKSYILERRQVALIQQENGQPLQVVSSVIFPKLHIFQMSSGSTPQHIAVAAQCPELLSVLLKRGADVYATDDNGLTPLHRALTVEKPEEFASCFESIDDLKDCILDCGLSHLHIACLVGSESCARKLLGRGANVEAIVSDRYSKSECKKVPESKSKFVDPYNEQPAEPMSFLAPYSGYRPLHFAVQANSPSVAKALLEHGADILAKSADGFSPLYRAFADRKNNCRDIFIKELKDNVTLQERVKKETGLTMLHFLCFLADVEAVKEKLTEDVDVNARARENSPIWPGCTPLHVLMRVPHDNPEGVAAIVVSMLIRGADVNALNAENESPIHIAYSRDCSNDEPGVRRHWYIVDMLRAQKDFSVNPVSCEGISHFHIACVFDVDGVVEAFLKNGTDPNTPIDHFNRHLVARLESTCFPGGSSPLQLALVHKSKKVFQLLLKWSVNLQAVDRHGRTPLHVAAAYNPNDKTYFEELIERKVDLYAVDICGTTPFGRLVDSDQVDGEIIKMFIKAGYPVNSFNALTEDGYIGLCILNEKDSAKPSLTFGQLMEAPSILDINDKGRNAVHNAVSLPPERALDSPTRSFVFAIDRLAQLGCDIDLPNYSGETPLHLAIRLVNFSGLIALLFSGADINLLDQDGKSAFDYVEKWPKDDYSEEMIRMILAIIHSYRFCGLYVCERIDKFYHEHIKGRSISGSYNEETQKELAALGNRRIGGYSLTLRDFVSETGAVADYPHMMADQRLAVDEFFKAEINNLREEFTIFGVILLGQYRKACKRVDLSNRAASSLDTLLGFDLPYLCSVCILKFLSNRDLELLIASADTDSE